MASFGTMVRELRKARKVIRDVEGVCAGLEASRRRPANRPDLLRRLAELGRALEEGGRVIVQDAAELASLRE